MAIAELGHLDKKLGKGVTIMRKLMFVVGVLTLGVLFSSMTATATPSTVTLDPSSPMTVTFSSGGGTVLFAPTSGPTSAGTGLLATAVSYSLAGGPVTLMNVISSAPFADYTVPTPTTPLAFELNGGSLLIGTLDLVSLAEFPGLHGVSVVSILGDLDITSLDGTVCTPTCPSGGNVLLNIVLPIGTFLPTSAGTQGAVIGGTDSLGPLTSTTPEPGSMLLYGSGLLALGVALRRRLIGQS
jgi:PEP-CTERM motif